jgi:hypothetical protein
MQFWMPPTYLRIVPGLIRLKHRRLPWPFTELVGGRAVQFAVASRAAIAEPRNRSAANAGFVGICRIEEDYMP